MHCSVEIVLGDLPQAVAAVKITPGLQPVGQVDDAVQRGHRGRADRVFFDGRKNRRVVDAEGLLREECAESRMQHDRVRAFERVDGHLAHLTFGDQAFHAIEPREIVQHACQAGFTRVDAMHLREQLGTPSYANDVRVAVSLAQMAADTLREVAVRQQLQIIGRTERATLGSERRKDPP